MRDTITIVTLVVFLGCITMTIDQRIELGINRAFDNQEKQCQ